MKKETLNFFARGLFYSKLNYCLPVYGNVFGLEGYKEENSRYQSYTTRDNQKLQVLQNKRNRLLFNAKYDTTTEVLLRDTNSLSIQQSIAYQTSLLAYKLVKEGKPSYLSERLKKKPVGMGVREGNGSISIPRTKLAITKEGFIYREA